MTANQEPKSPSEDTNLYTTEIEPLLQPHRAVVKIDQKELRKRFNEFFSVHEDGMVAHYKVKGQKLKGGKVKSARKILEGQLGVNNMYVDVLNQILQEQLTDVFFVEGCRVANFEEKDKPEAALVAKFYYSPELELLEGAEISYECENPVRQSEDGAWADKCKELQQKHKYTEEYTAASLDTDDLEVLIDLIVSDDKYTLRRKWIELVFLPSALQTEIKAHAVGDLFETKYQAHALQNNPPDDLEDKVAELDAHVKIYEVRKVIRPDVDDALAVKEEFESLELLKTQFQVDFDEYTERARGGVAFNHIVNQIIGGSKLPHIPDVIIEREMQTRLAEHMAGCRDGEKQAMMIMGVDNREDMEKKIRAQVIQEILSGLAARKYAAMHELPVKEQVLVDHMVNEIEWQEREEVKDA